MKNIKLNKLAESKLNEKEMVALTGGYIVLGGGVAGGEQKACGCACQYEGNGGSSTGTNGSANFSDGKWSPQS